MNRMNDLISRQAAIATAHLPRVDDAGYEIVRLDDILKLPSAQPEIIRCKDCKNWDRTWKSERPNYHYCPIIDGIRNGFWYCADGQKRNNDDSILY